ncbi:hypothetical protein OG948_25045 [Embleya sp. NBC_00888]|uniref:hypothetical protein n=1 Tax=Embleya sp. NBC_00888 TaxID=2975960 RepID=UPI00386B19CF|nr:hypothetical protein OG948_25045 [Embleya sp. NBC_00888]
MTTSRRLLGALMAGFCAIALPSGAWPAGATLLGESAVGPDPARPWVLREGPMAVSPKDFDFLCRVIAPAPRQITLRLFPDVIVKVVEDAVEIDDEGTAMWSGHVLDAPASPTNFAVTGTCPGGPVSVAGAVDIGDLTYALTPGTFGTNTVHVEEIARWAIPIDGKPTHAAGRGIPAPR